MTIHGIFDATLSDDSLNAYTWAHPGTVLVIPGGGYEHLSPRESEPVANAFRAYGFRSLIFRYDVTTSVLKLMPLQELAWAVTETRKLYPDEPVYLMGFSAGAHLALSLGVHYDDPDWNGKSWFSSQSTIGTSGSSKEPLFSDSSYPTSGGTISPENLVNHSVDSQIIRPDGIIAAYPVVTAYEHAHEGSIRRLIGKPEDAMKNFGSGKEYERAKRWFSLEKALSDKFAEISNVSANLTSDENSTETLKIAPVPPCFLWQTETDDAVPVENSMLFVSEMIRKHIPVEYHIYPKGVHGLSLATEEVSQPEKGRFPDPHVAGWLKESVDWLIYQFDK